MERTKWVDRIFSFDIPEGWIFNILERLHGTSVRLNELCHNLTEEAAAHKINGKWSIKEHIGHLRDLEFLHQVRINEFTARKEVLSAADMTNAKTDSSNHNETELSILLSNFKTVRTLLIDSINNLDDQTMQLKAMHHRLKVMVKPVDIAFFIAEHDDHHLTDIRELIKGKHVNSIVNSF